MSWHFSVVQTPAALHLFKKPPELQTLVEQAARNALMVEARQQIKLFERTTAYWRHQVDFDWKIESMGDVLQLSVFTDDKIYFFLNYGTSVRYATMSSEFQRKTNPGSLRSNRGRPPFDPLYVSRKRPRRGIEARMWTDQIFDLRRPIFIKNITKAVLKVARDFWAGSW